MTPARSLPSLAAAGAVALLAAVVLAGVLIATAPAKASTDGPGTGQPFAADSSNKQVGDTCPMGLTSGTLDWHTGLGPRTPGIIGSTKTVDVAGIVADHPLPSDLSTACGEDGRFTTATFAAYSAGVQIASSAQKADNGELDFSFALKAAQPIQLITVQVCRTTLDPAPFTYCGLLQKYPAPIAPTG